MMDEDSGRFLSVVQNQFVEFVDTTFDRMNLFLSTQHKHWYIFDNVRREVVASGEFDGQPIGALGAADGKMAYVAFSDVAEVAAVDLESGAIQLVPATENGSGAFTIGLSNNVCH